MAIEILTQELNLLSSNSKKEICNLIDTLCLGIKLKFVFYINIIRSFDSEIDLETKTKLLIILSLVYMICKRDGHYLNPCVVV